MFSLEEYWASYEKDARSKNITDEKLISGYKLSQTTNHYLRVVNKYPEARIFLTPNLADPGELLGFMEKDNAATSLTMPKFENTVLPIFSILCKVDSTSFSISNKGPFSPFSEQDTLVVWGYNKSELDMGIIKPYAVSMKRLSRSKDSFTLFQKENMFILPSLYIGGETEVAPDINGTVRLLKKNIKANNALKVWEYFPGTY